MNIKKLILYIFQKYITIFGMEILVSMMLSIKVLKQTIRNILTLKKINKWEKLFVTI